MNFCKNCGSQINQGEAFCRNCGTNLNNNMNQANTNVNNPINNNMPNTNYSNQVKNVQTFNKNAILSIILSSVSLIILWWLGLVGIGCGVNALREIKNRGEKGKILAIIGIILGVISIILFSLILPILTNQNN